MANGVFCFSQIVFLQRSHRPFKDSFAAAAAVFVAAGKRETIWRAFVAALVATVLIYRLELGSAIYLQASQIARLQPAAVPVGKFLQAAFNDFTFVGLLALFYLGLKILAARFWPRLAAKTIVQIGEGLLAAGLVLLLALADRTHYQLLLQLDTGLTLEIMKAAPELVGPGDFFRMLTRPDIVSILTPLLVFVLAWWFARKRPQTDKYGLAVLLGFGLCAHLAGPQTLPSEIASDPAVYFSRTAIEDWVNELFQENDYFAKRGDMPGAEQTNSIQLVDAAFVNSRPRPPAPRPGPAVTADGKPWNVIFFVLESSGADYVFDKSLGGPAPRSEERRVGKECS